MEFTQVVKKRAMIRQYQNKPVPQDLIEQILDNARRAPSAGFTQPQEFIVIRNQQQKDKLVAAALGQEQIAQAPVVVAVVCNTARSAARYGERGRNFYSIIDGAFSSMLILLSCVNLGLGASYVAAFDDEEVAKVLELPSHVRPIGLISIGFPAQAPAKYKRIPFEKIIHHEKW